MLPSTWPLFPAYTHRVAGACRQSGFGSIEFHLPSCKLRHFFCTAETAIYGQSIIQNNNKQTNSNNGRVLYGGLCETGVDLPFLHEEPGE